MMRVIDLKKAVRARDGFRCAQCGLTNDEHRQRTGKQLEVHRLEPGSLYTMEGCVTLCRQCHGPQPRRKRGQPDLAHPGKMQAWIDADVFDALDDYTDGAEPRVSKTAAIESALKDFLRKQGFWPRPTPQPDE
jgi:cytochrome c553